jgi:RTX calcium-binding nonapeptide repeat (4 copies)
VARQGHLISVVGTFLMGCAIVVLVVSCAGKRSEAPEEEQGHTEATKEQAHSAPCEGTRTFQTELGPTTTNDVPGCPKGGVLSGTDGEDQLNGMKGDDEIRGLGGPDEITDGPGRDLVYGGAEGDNLIGYGGDISVDRFYGGRGSDTLQTRDVPAVKDVVRCGAGIDTVYADKADVVFSDKCERVRA